MTFTDQANKALAAVFSCSGPSLSAEERSFFKDSNPLGFILFGRNCETPEQLSALVAELKDTVGRDCPILIDQEGGRVQRLKPPIWRGFPAMRFYGGRAEVDMQDALSDLHFSMMQLSEDLRASGINVNCAPVLDLLLAETHDAIGDRAFSADPDVVAAMGIAVCELFQKGGLTPVIKHLPGHGRARSDSHKDLPRIATPRSELEQTDFKPFRAVADAACGAGAWGMAAHVVYEDIDPDHPASVSLRVIEDIIRGDIGFDGLLLSDDLDMEALAGYGDAAARALASIKAGCDVALYCSGRLKDMQAIAGSVPNLSAKAQKSLQKSEELRTLAA